MFKVSHQTAAEHAAAMPGQEALGLPSATFDAINSFIVLAKTLNLSETVRVLGVTRQTVRRHINLLECIRNTVLFEKEGGAYRLTREGQAEYRSVSSIQTLTSRWAAGMTQTDPMLESCKYRSEAGGYYISQQYPVVEMLRSGPEMLKRVFQAWASSCGEIEATGFKRVKQDVLVYREQFDSWLCVHVGEKSALATWLGAVWAKSVIGALLDDDPVNNPSDRFVKQAYREVMDTGNCRGDQAAVRLSRGPDSTMEAVNYHRLLLPCRFPDGSPALTVCTFRTNQIDLGFLSDGDIEPMPASFEMVEDR
jgi:hypothetical protein